MLKVIAAINTTIDGYCDHTAIDPDDEIHQHYVDLLSESGAALYGRITYQLMEYWKELIVNPSGNKVLDDFAVVMDRIPKIVFSNKLKSLDWESARLATKPIEEELLELKQQTNKDILVGSRSLIMHLLNLNLIDEFQLCIHPVIAGEGLLLFEQLHTKQTLKLNNIKRFKGGAVILNYKL